MYFSSKVKFCFKFTIHIDFETVFIHKYQSLWIKNNGTGKFDRIHYTIKYYLV